MSQREQTPARRLEAPPRADTLSSRPTLAKSLLAVKAGLVHWAFLWWNRPFTVGGASGQEIVSCLCIDPGASREHRFFFCLEASGGSNHPSHQASPLEAVIIMATMTKTNTQQQQQQQTPTRDKENSANRERGPSPGNAWDQGRGAHPLGSYPHNAPKKTTSKHGGGWATPHARGPAPGKPSDS